MVKRGRKFNNGRREFLKYSGKVATRAVGYGFLGNLIGRLYRGGRDTYREDISPYVDKGKDLIDKTGKRMEKVKEVFDKYNPFHRADENLQEVNEEKKISRRSLLTLPFRFFHEYPTSTATAVGMTYGGAKQALKSREKYTTEKRINELDAKLNHLIELHESKKESGLEKEVSESETLIALGIVGFLISFASFSFGLTGFSIAENIYSQNNFIDGFIFILSLVLIFIGVLRRKS